MPDDEFRQTDRYYVKKVLERIRVADVMSSKVVGIRMDEPFSRVAGKMKEHGIRHLPVVDKDNKVVGVITQRDLFRIESPHRNEEGDWFYDPETLDNHILRHVMTPEPFTLSAEASMAEVIIHMADRKHGAIPVVDAKEKLCGIITQTDVLRLAAGILRE